MTRTPSSKVPAFFATASAWALLYADRVTPLIVSPQSGWHFAAAARWVWLGFGAAGAAKGLLFALTLLRLSSAPPAVPRTSGSAAAAKPAESCAKTTSEQQQQQQHVGIDKEAGRQLLLRTLALFAFLIASTAAAAPAVVKAIGGRVGSNFVLLKVIGDVTREGMAGAERTAQVLAAVALGPLFWALGFTLAASGAAWLLDGRQTWLRRMAVLLVLAAGAVAAAGDLLLDLLPPWLPSSLQAAGISLPLPPRPISVTLTAISAVFGLAAVMAPLWLTSADRPPGLKELAAQKRGRGAAAVGRSAVHNCLRLLSMAWLAVVAQHLWKLNEAAMGRGPTFQTSDTKFDVLWRQETALGEYVSLVEGAHQSAQFRLLRAGHSILGGMYIEPPWFANQSIYDIFYVHEGVRLITPGQHALHIGLGIGISANGLTAHGETVDVVELHPEVVAIAEKYFWFKTNGTVLAWDAAEAVDDMLSEEVPPLYDHIVHDVFSGGAIPRRLLEPAFLWELRKLLVPGGVLALNFFGNPEAEPARRMALNLQDVFGQVRAFAESSNVKSRNIVFFASTSAIRIRRPTEADELENGQRRNAYKRYFTPIETPGEAPKADDGGRLNPREVDLSWLRDGTQCPGPPPNIPADTHLPMPRAPAAYVANDAADAYAAGEHWRIMRRVFDGHFWGQTY